MDQNKKKNSKKPLTQKQQIAKLEKNMLAFKKEMIELIGKLVKGNNAYWEAIEDVSVELTKQVKKVTDEMVGLQGGVDLICRTFKEQGVSMGLSMQKIYDGFERVQGIIDQKMFYAEERNVTPDWKKAEETLKSEIPKKETSFTPGKLKAPVPGEKKDTPYTTNVRQFRELMGMDVELYDIMVAGRFGDEVRVKPYNKETKKNFVDGDQFKTLARALADRGFGRLAGLNGYFSNKIRPQRQWNSGGGSGYRRRY